MTITRRSLPLRSHPAWAIAMAVALLGLLAVVCASAASGAGSHRVYLGGPVDDNGNVTFLYKPKTAILGERQRVVGLHWSAWSRSSATGTGTAQLLSYTSKDVGHEHPKVVAHFSARLTLSHPGGGDVCDKPVWGRATVKRLAGTQPKKFPKSFDVTPLCDND